MVTHSIVSPSAGPLGRRGNSSNEIPPTPALGELKEYVGFLVSRRLTLPAAQPDESQALFDDLIGPLGLRFFGFFHHELGSHPISWPLKNCRNVIVLLFF